MVERMITIRVVDNQQVVRAHTTRLRLYLLSELVKEVMYIVYCSVRCVPVQIFKLPVEHLSATLNASHVICAILSFDNSVPGNLKTAKKDFNVVIRVRCSGYRSLNIVNEIRGITADDRVLRSLTVVGGGSWRWNCTVIHLNNSSGHQKRDVEACGKCT